VTIWEELQKNAFMWVQHVYTYAMAWSMPGGMVIKTAINSSYYTNSFTVISQILIQIHGFAVEGGFWSARFNNVERHREHTHLHPFPHVP